MATLGVGVVYRRMREKARDRCCVEQAAQSGLMYPCHWHHDRVGDVENEAAGFDSSAFAAMDLKGRFGYVIKWRIRKRRNVCTKLCSSDVAAAH